MKCVIPGNHLKVFARAVHSLSKIGDELYIEPFTDGLALRTINSSRSAYAFFRFNPSFFHEYEYEKPSQSDSEDDRHRCKIAMKSCLAVFRSLSSIERTVERCKLKLDVDEARLIFQLYCRHGIVKTHNLSFIECESLQAVFSADVAKSHLTAQSRLLCDVVANFQNNQEEVTMMTSEESVLFRNYCDDAPDPNKIMRTEMSLNSDEFDTYTVNEKVDITFCLKELRAILSFCDTTNLPLSFHFDEAGKPIIFTITGDTLFDANFVLATLAEPADASRSQDTTDVSQNQSKSASKSRKHVNPCPNENTVHISNDTSVMEQPETRLFNGLANNHTVQSSPTHSRPIQENCVITATDQNARTSGSSNASSSPVIPPILPDKSREEQVMPADDDNLDDEFNDTIPGTPPSKKFKSLFFGLSQSTHGTERSQHESEVLAADSD